MAGIMWGGWGDEKWNHFAQYTPKSDAMTVFSVVVVGLALYVFYLARRRGWKKVKPVVFASIFLLAFTMLVERVYIWWLFDYKKNYLSIVEGTYLPEIASGKSFNGNTNYRSLTKCRDYSYAAVYRIKICLRERNGVSAENGIDYVVETARPQPYTWYWAGNSPLIVLIDGVSVALVDNNYKLLRWL